MSLRIQTNSGAFDGNRNLINTENQLSTAIARLSSCFRIHRASDDAAGLAISEKLQAQIGGLEQAQRNGQDAVSLVQTAEGSLSEVHSMLQRIRELAVQYKNGSLSASDQNAISSEVTQLQSEIQRIGADAEFNGIKLLNGAVTVTFQVGPDDGQVITI